MSGTPDFPQAENDEINALQAEREVLAPKWMNDRDLAAGLRLRGIEERLRELWLVMDAWVGATI